MVTCSNCGLEQDPTQQENHFDGGLRIDLNSLGYYGGFWDSVGESKTAELCHDCCLYMMKCLPGLAKTMFPEGGGHPNKMYAPKEHTDGINTPSCCEYAWTWNTEELDEHGQWQTYFGTADGNWQKVNYTEGALRRVK